MSTHFVHDLKHSHDRRRVHFRKMVKNGNAVVVRRMKNAAIVKTVDGFDYRISKRGNVIKQELGETK